MDIFTFRDHLIDDYSSYIQSFIQIRNPLVQAYVQEQLNQGVLWPNPLIQLSPLFESGASVDTLVAEGVLHPECARIFRVGKTADGLQGRSLQLHKHQDEAIRIAARGASYVLTTGTGSGKSLTYMIPLVDAILRNGTKRGVQAIVVYPMNALANSQRQELEKFLTLGYASGKSPVTFARYTGQEKQEERDRILADPPDILLTNYVMLELILTRSIERPLLRIANLRFLVLDELHTYRGRQGADVALLVRRVRDRIAASNLQCVGTSATLSSEGSYEEQRRVIADMASQIFGTEVLSQHVIGETLKRSTRETLSVRDADGAYTDTFKLALTQRISDIALKPPTDYEAFLHDPLSIWLEDTFGVSLREGRLVRTEPQSIEGLQHRRRENEQAGAAHRLHMLTGVSINRCIQVIQEGLLAGYTCSPDPITGRSPFAFRLHQFISKGDAIYASLDADPYLTFQGQTFVPGDRSRVLLPLVFCRECGQEYYSVRRIERSEDGISFSNVYINRLPGVVEQEEGQEGFLYYSQENPWPEDEDALLERLPEEWLEEFHGSLRVRRTRLRDVPQAVRVQPDGKEIERDRRAERGLDMHFLHAPFRFCLNCGVSYGGRQRNDFSKLASLSSEGRSTATTILSLSAMLRVKEDPHHTIPPKMLSFTDNRQDASLQAGHFNDFVDVGLLRSALYQAVKRASDEGIRHEELTKYVFEALHLPLNSYATDPNVKYQALNETQRALRNVLGYRLYRDLKRGWRITSPNLEQCGLLIIDYLSLDEVCEDQEVWQEGKGGHSALVTASPETRKRIARVLLDYMRRELSIKVDYLTPEYQENMQQQSSQRLIAPWAIDENEPMQYATTLFPRSRGQESDRSYVYLSARGGFGQYLRRPKTFPEYHERLRSQETEQIILHLLSVLKTAGLVEQVAELQGKQRNGPDETNYGYQLPASALIWKFGDGTRAFHDPITIPHEPSEGRRTNAFFVEFYRTTAAKLEGLEAREHTAQVPYDLREKREQAFRANTLPILYCSPTMELGIDIAELNLVNMRNMPPTPANYAQRSGRAGRIGQPALVFSYCSTGSPHDQYFFKRPEQMVAGAVTPPRLDLANEDLIRAHVYAIWLAETEMSLGQSLRDILDVSGDSPTLELLDSKRASIDNPTAKRSAYTRAKHALSSIEPKLAASGWYTENWLSEALEQVALRFDRTCDRWRGLYRSALAQSKAQSLIVLDASRSSDDKRQAERLRGEAESQLKLLTDVEHLEQSDFYSYRYFASEGFLPGYNFPRLPLSAYIPARRSRQHDEYLSRPRFLAISEFGPRAIVYHEGSRYLINRVILSGEHDREDITTRQVKQCGQCGYLHTFSSNVDVCERCGTKLGTPLTSLFRLQNVATKRRDKINSDEEERMRLGYEIRTAMRFSEQDGHPSTRVAQVMLHGQHFATLTYGHAATLWRINLGWQRRKNHAEHGFLLDIERGYWGKDEPVVEESPESGDPISPRTRRVIPYVEDQRNCLLFELHKRESVTCMASLQSALKRAIQIHYQLEDNELAAEPLPDDDHRHLLLIYEATEGGAGVLRRLLDEPEELSEVAREALRLCHFDPDTGNDLKHAERAREDCETACYDCLLTYYNQRDHRILDRKTIHDLLLDLMNAQVHTSPTSKPRADHLATLHHLSGSSLERDWLTYVHEQGYRLPSHAQHLIETCQTRPDFLYQEQEVAIYVDGPFHDYPDRRTRDVAQEECLGDMGYMVIRFGARDDWSTIVAQYPHIFGEKRR